MNIFIVETPLQMVNAIEARHYFPKEDAILFIFSIFQEKTFYPLLQTYNWQGEKYYFREKPWEKNQLIISKLRRRMRVDKIVRAARTAQEANILFLGNYVRAHMRHIANRLKYKTLILLDDGTDALQANAMRYIPMPEPQNLKEIMWWQSLKRYIFNKYIYLDIRELPSVTFFSTYDLNIRASDYLIKNDYRHLKKLAIGRSKTDEIYFLGQPLCDDGYVKREVYFTYMGHICDTIGAKNLIYLPHPRESEEVVRGLVKRYGFLVRRFNLPIEIQMLLGSNLPKALTGFFSSALDNCRILFGKDLEITAYYIDPKDLLKDKKFVYDIYSYMKKNTCNNFQVVELLNSLSNIIVTQSY